VAPSSAKIGSFSETGRLLGYYTAGRGFNLPGLARLQASDQFFTDSRFNFSSATVDDADTYCHLSLNLPESAIYFYSRLWSYS
jgi:hypothetical protein